MLRALLPLIAALLCTAGQAGENELARVSRERAAWAARIAPAVVAVEARSGAKGERFYGAGTIVSPDGLILTSVTAVPPQAQQVRVIRADGTSLTATRVCCAPETETVSVVIPAPDVAADRLGRTAPEFPPPAR